MRHLIFILFRLTVVLLAGKLFQNDMRPLDFFGRVRRVFVLQDYCVSTLLVVHGARYSCFYTEERLNRGWIFFHVLLRIFCFE